MPVSTFIFVWSIVESHDLFRCSRDAPPMTSYVAHIAVYCWAVSDPEDWSSDIVTILYPFSSPRDPPTSQQWLKEVAVLDAGFASRAAKSLTLCVRQPWLLGQTLEMYMEFWKAFIVFGSATFHGVILDNLAVLVLSLGSVLRRGMCCGQSGKGCQNGHGCESSPIAGSVFTIMG